MWGKKQDEDTTTPPHSDAFLLINYFDDNRPVPFENIFSNKDNKKRPYKSIFVPVNPTITFAE